MSDSDSEEEYEFYDYGRDKDDKDEIIVAGGGLMNGNAYATVKQFDNGYIRYHEYGQHAFSRMYRNHYLAWNSSQFNIEEKDPSSIITIQAFMRGSKVRCGPERWNLMFWNLKRFMDKNGRVPNKH
jgi:hypothetical protein